MDEYENAHEALWAQATAVVNPNTGGQRNGRRRGYGGRGGPSAPAGGAPRHAPVLHVSVGGYRLDVVI